MNIRNGEKIENNFSQEKRGKEKWVQKKIKTCTKFSRSIVITFLPQIRYNLVHHQ